MAWGGDGGRVVLQLLRLREIEHRRKPSPRRHCRCLRGSFASHPCSLLCWPCFFSCSALSLLGFVFEALDLQMN